MSIDKKLLANQIKGDLRKDLAEAKKGDKQFTKKSWEKSLGGGCSEPRGNEERIWYNGSVETAFGREKAKAARGGIFSDELDNCDWNEITGLIQQIDNINETIREKKKRKRQELETKLNSNSELFLYEGDWEWKSSSDIRHVFRGMKDSQEFYLVFPENSPIILSLPDHEEVPNKKQDKILVLIRGIENIPFQPEEELIQYPWKEITLSDKITITEFKEIPENPVFNDQIPNSRNGKKVLLIGGGIVGALVIALIIRLFLKRKIRLR